MRQSTINDLVHPLAKAGSQVVILGVYSMRKISTNVGGVDPGFCDGGLVHALMHVKHAYF